MADHQRETSPHRSTARNGSDILKERSPIRSDSHSQYRDRSSSCENRGEPERGRTAEREPSHDSEKQDTTDDLMKLMGFSSFNTTKNKHVEGVGNGSVKKNKKAKFRQYMNREKGFNRALSQERKPNRD